jgi:hypothetical protein
LPRIASKVIKDSDLSRRRLLLHVLDCALRVDLSSQNVESSEVKASVLVNCELDVDPLILGHKEGIALGLVVALEGEEVELSMSGVYHVYHKDTIQIYNVAAADCCCGIGLEAAIGV